jgi:gamma-D-glutamyl-L-lysine dipeptidyl-peptidase
MQYFACIVPVAHLRKEATHRSEMVSQLLFGEFAEAIEETKDFIKIKCLYDDYEGWVQRSQLVVVDEVTTKQKISFVNEWAGEVLINDTLQFVPFGASIFYKADNYQLGNYTIAPDVNDFLPGIFSMGDDEFYRIATLFENTTYLWGGKSVFGIDCSGYAQQVFKVLGIWLPRDAYQQAEHGELVDFLQAAQCGDLAFFDNEEGKITHVGILLNNETIIHASGKVRIDRIDNAGIISSTTGERTHALRVIKRYSRT